MRRFRKLLPSAESIRENRWLRWLGPALHHPRLWHMSRRGLALGLALGLFFGLLVPLAQIPLSAAAAVALRANIPAAVASTLVTNPVTFGPIYYAAWRVGNAILGEPENAAPPSLAQVAAEPEVVVDESWASNAVRRVMQVGKPLLLGLLLMASTAGFAAYFLVSAGWRLSVICKRRRRLDERSRAPAPSDNTAP